MSGWMGFDAVPIELVRNERFAGKTKYTLKKMIRLAMDGIIGFSDRPLTLCGGFGVFTSIIAGLGLIALIVLACCGVKFPAWLWAVDGVVLLQGLTFLFLCIQGAYMNRMYDELKQRPLYIVAEELNF